MERSLVLPQLLFSWPCTAWLYKVEHKNGLITQKKKTTENLWKHIIEQAVQEQLATMWWNKKIRFSRYFLLWCGSQPSNAWVYLHSGSIVIFSLQNFAVISSKTERWYDFFLLRPPLLTSCKSRNRRHSNQGDWLAIWRHELVKEVGRAPILCGFGFDGQIPNHKESDSFS